MGYYIVKKASNGRQYMFNLHAGNHQVILTSEMYESKQGCLNGVASCQTISPNDHNYDRRKSSNGKWYFNLKASNGQVIGTSEMYESEGGRENGIRSCRENGPTKDVRDLT